MQTKQHSLLETLSSTAIGFAISSLLWPLVITPLLGVRPSVKENLAITLIFTFASLARGYLMRRLWNRREVWSSLEIPRL